MWVLSAAFLVHNQNLGYFELVITTRTHTCTHTHVHTHTCTHTRAPIVLRLFWILSGTTQVSRYQNSKNQGGKTKLDLLEQEIVSGVASTGPICKSAPHPRQITMTTSHHSAFCKPDALPAAQPTASKHWKHMVITNTMILLNIIGSSLRHINALTSLKCIDAFYVADVHQHTWSVSVVIVLKSMYYFNIKFNSRIMYARDMMWL